MANVIVFCPGTVGQSTSQDQGGNTVYTATCSEAWQQMPVPPSTLDAEEFAGFFFGVLVSTLTFYFVAVLPLGRLLRFIAQGLRDLL